jgi:cytochrome P450
MTTAIHGDTHEFSSGTITSSTPLYPPRVIPRDRPMGFLSFFANLLRNPLRVLPAAVYEEDIVVAERAGLAVCWITEPSLIKTVLLDKRQDFPRTEITLRVLGPLLGNGVLTADGADWKWQRQTAAPVFRHNDLLSFVPTIVGAAERLLDEWRSGAPRTIRAIDRDMIMATFDVISHTLLPGGDTHIRPLLEGPHVDYQDRLGWQMAYANIGLPAWLPHPGKLKMRYAERELRRAVATLVAERRANPTSNDDLLQRLANATNPDTGAQMSEELLIDNLLTFFLAGHETTAKALTWTLYLLARAPEWQTRILEEVRRVAGEAPIRADDIDKLSVTSQVLKESMRLFPPAPIIARRATVDIELGGKPIKAGTQIVIPIFAIQRHKRHWSDPDRFDPTRFTPENEARISRYHYMPFGAGPRICIGMAFAMIEGIAILATLVRAARFTTSLDHEPEPVSRITLRPAGGMPLTVLMR